MYNFVFIRIKQKLINSMSLGKIPNFYQVLIWPTFFPLPIACLASTPFFFQRRILLWLEKDAYYPLTSNIGPT